MSEREQIIANLRQHAAMLREYHVRELRLFGSAARHESDEHSDIDLLVEFDRPTGYFALLRLQAELSAILGKPVDLGTPDSLHPRIREQVLRESVRAA